jgi:hypothetical protein
VLVLIKPGRRLSTHAMASITPIQAFSLGADAAYLSKRPLPAAPDGHYDWQNQADANTSPQAHSGVTNLLNTVNISLYILFYP